MAFLTELWLAILLAAVFVFVVSSVIHMLTPMHKSDLTKMPSEDAVLEAIRAGGVKPGAYMFPCAADMKAMGSPEMKAKMKRGPVGLLTVVPPGGFNMGKNLGLWFAFSVVISFFAAYIGWNSLGANTEYLAVFRITGAAAFMGYAASHLSDSIWKGASWKTTGKFMLDGLAYALVTGGTFGWLWSYPVVTGA